MCKLRKKHLLITLLISTIIAVFFTIDVKLKYDINLYEYLKIKFSDTDIKDDYPDGKNFTIGTTANPPLTFYQNNQGENIGIIPDFISIINLSLGKDISITYNSYTKNLNALDSGKINSAFLPYSKDLDKKYSHGMTAFTIKGKVLVLNDSSIHDLNDLKGKLIVGLKRDRDSQYTTYDDNFFKNNNILRLESIYQCFAMLNKGYAAGIICDDTEAVYFAKITQGMDKYKLLDKAVYSKKYAFIVREKDKTVLNALNKALISIKYEGLDEKTQSKWIGEYHNSIITVGRLNLAYKIVFPVVLLISIFILWNRNIANKVNERTYELYQSKEELNSIINNINSGIIVLDRNLKILECNNFIEEMFKIPKKDIIGSAYNKFDFLLPFFNENNINKVYNIDERYLYVTHQSFSDNKLIVIDDCTELYLREKKLRHESNLSSLGQLVAGLAHEIRNPLAIIKSYVYILKHDTDNEDTLQSLNIINDNVTRIGNFVTNLLDFSRLSKNFYGYVNIRELLDDILVSFNNRLEKEKITIIPNISSETSEYIFINIEVVKMVLINLIENSIEALATDEKSNKVIKIEFNYKQGNTEISVEDNGPGIEKKLFDEIFNPFFSTKDNGTGLGLYLISREISNEKGSIDLESKKGQGTKFTVRLPDRGEMRNGKKD